TFEHNLIDKWDHDTLVKTYCIEGARDIDGTIDISLDEGGGKHFGEIMKQTEFDVIIGLGGAGCPTLTLSNFAVSLRTSSCFLTVHLDK
ncbi:unnamed protein product, partial [marine sediment metagenome]